MPVDKSFSSTQSCWVNGPGFGQGRSVEKPDDWLTRLFFLGGELDDAEVEEDPSSESEDSDSDDDEELLELLEGVLGRFRRLLPFPFP